MILAVGTLEGAVAVATIIGGIAAVLALKGVFARFRPSFSAAIDANRQAIRLDVANRGGKPGRINSVGVVGADWETSMPSKFATLPDGKFHSAELKPGAERHLIVMAGRDSGPFSPEAIVYVRWGNRKERYWQRPRRAYLEPVQVTDVSYYGEDSDWPTPS